MKSTVSTAISLIVCALAATATSGLMFFEGVFSREAWWTSFLGYEAWMLSPYCYLAAMALISRWSPLESRVIAVASIILAAFAGYVQADAFVLHRSPNSAVLFFWMPTFQWLAAMAAGVIAAFAGRLARSWQQKRSRRSAL